MTSKPSHTEISFSPDALRQHDDLLSVDERRLNAVLHAYSRATPIPGLEARIAAQLVAGSQQPGWRPAFSGNGRLLRGFSIAALAAAAACALVVGTVQHSQRIQVRPIALRPQAPVGPETTGVAPAGSSHLPVRAIPQTATINPRSPRTPPRSRATVSGSQVRHGANSAVPKSPYPPVEPDSGASDTPQ